MDDPESRPIPPVAAIEPSEEASSPLSLQVGSVGERVRTCVAAIAADSRGDRRPFRSYRRDLSLKRRTRWSGRGGRVCPSSSLPARSPRSDGVRVERRWAMFGLLPRMHRNVLTPRAEPPLGFFPEEFTSLFNRLLPAWPIEERAEWPYGWGLTTEEKEKEFLVRVEMPGFTPNEIRLEVLP